MAEYKEKGDRFHRDSKPESAQENLTASAGTVPAANFEWYSPPFLWGAECYLCFSGEVKILE